MELLHEAYFPYSKCSHGFELSDVEWADPERGPPVPIYTDTHAHNRPCSQAGLPKDLINMMILYDQKIL